MSATSTSDAVESIYNVSGKKVPLYFYRTQWTAEGSVSGAVCDFLLVYEIFR